MSTLHRWLILLLMLILPVQGLAAAYAPMHKALATQATTAMPCHEQQQYPDAQHANHAAADNETTGTAHHTDATSHLCCQQVFTGAISNVLTVSAHKFSDVSRFVLPLATLYIPDSPDRPPRG